MTSVETVRSWITDAPTEDMIEQCILSPVKSDHHNFVASQKTAYDCLNHKGRTLYDNLRTQFGLSHSAAFDTALERYGLCATLWI